MFFINLGECFRRVDPETYSDLMWEDYTWPQEPRGLTELLAAHHQLELQVWYNRHRTANGRSEKEKYAW